VLKHVLIVHLSFLDYKCDTCTQFYAFDEPQTKQHAGLVHQCITTDTQTTSSCHFKLINTEEEINLAINKARQYIAKILAQTKVTPIKARTQIIATVPNILIEAQPKYKCCRCTVTQTESGQMQPTVLNSYQDALYHVMSSHMMTNQNKKDKKLNYELELFEQNLEDLIASETGQITTATANAQSDSTLAQQLDDDSDDDDEEENCDFVFDDLDLNDWNVVLSEQSPNGNKRKRFKTNNNTSLSDTDLYQSYKRTKRFYFKSHLVYRCQLCSRKMNSFDFEHWLQHDQENHFKLMASLDRTIKQSMNCFKCTKTFPNFVQF
jgi:hypothetical protein